MTLEAHGGRAWDRVRSELRGFVGEATYSSWLKSVELQSKVDGTITLSAPSRLNRQKVEQEFGSRIRDLWMRHDPDVKRVCFVVDEGEQTQAAEIGGARDTEAFRRDVAISVAAGQGRERFKTVGALAGAQMRPRGSMSANGDDEGENFSVRLNAAMSFETFLQGRGNKVAYDAAKEIAEDETVIYNPLYMYGPPGIGKTHLLHALVRRRKQTSPGCRILFITAETFLAHFVEAVKRKDTMSFKTAVRNVDVLVIDDFWHIVGKMKTEQEFLNTIAVLMDEGRQVVIAADRSPNDLAEVDAKLRSRLKNGLTIELKPADSELRRAILQQQAEAFEARSPGVVIEPEALDFLASRLTSDLRTLIGSFNQLCMTARSEGGAVTVALAKAELANELRERDRRFSMEEVIRVVTDFYRLAPGDLESECRVQTLVRPRHIAMWFCKSVVGKSYPQIGKRFGNRNHATVMHGVKKIECMRDSDPEIYDEIERIRRRIEDGPEALH